MTKSKSNAVRLYVGSNNFTHEVEIAKLRAILDGELEAYTIIPASGVWRGVSEDSAIVEISGINALRARAIAESLKIKLDQQAIGISTIPALAFI